MTTPIATYRSNADDAMESRVFDLGNRFSVALVDLDSGETVPYIRAYPTRDAAIAAAIALVAL